MTTEWQLFEITQRGRNFPVSGNGVERGTAVRAKYSRKVAPAGVEMVECETWNGGEGTILSQARRFYNLLLLGSASG